MMCRHFRVERPRIVDQRSKSCGKSGEPVACPLWVKSGHRIAGDDAKRGNTGLLPLRRPVRHARDRCGLVRK